MTKVADSKFGKFMKFIHDIIERVLKGSLDPDLVIQAVRPLIGQSVKITLEQALNNLEEAMRARFGEKSDLHLRADISLSLSLAEINEAKINAEPQCVISTSVYNLPSEISYRDIQKESRGGGDTYEPHLVQGIIDATKLINDGEMDTYRKAITIYLANNVDGKKKSLVLWYSSAGSIVVSFSSVNPDNELFAGVGVLRKKL